jgi:uncharacterized protein
VARRVHKERGVPCRLKSIEDHVLGFAREDDVPSSEVCSYYLHFLRTGDARALLGVVDHNAWDVVSMASLVGVYGEPLETTTLSPADLVGVGRAPASGSGGSTPSSAPSRAGRGRRGSSPAP